MSVLSIPNSFSPNTTILSSQVNANYSAIATEYNSHAVQTDVSKTITVTHTFSVSQTFSAGLSTAGAIVHTLAASQVIPGATSYSIRNNANNADNLLITDAGAVTLRSNLTASAVSGQHILQADLGVRVRNNTAPRYRTDFFINPTNAAWVAFDDTGAVYMPAVWQANTFALQPNGDSTKGLTVAASGDVAAKQNMSVAGNLTVTGTISAIQGGNLYVRRTSDLNFTSGTDSTLTFAIGATEEWEFEWVLAHTNASAATATFTVNGPASSAAIFGAFSTINGAGSAVQGAAQIAMASAATGITMNSTAGFTHIRGYAKGGGTPGNVTLTCAASAGTGVLKSGSYVRYSRIA